MMDDITRFMVIFFGILTVSFFLFAVFWFGVSEGYKESELIWQKKLIKAGCAEYNRTNGKFIIKKIKKKLKNFKI